ncbi:hypothetical protein OHA37_23465 [Streptomyces sp. NBC_00335]|uniref:hypothetical protein n=1 Tax=unclassified Streptomyces TaxID=2593676 RepID=UPI00224D1942|nr:MULTISPECIES: hypothetical protein [unclassified Streptomyces]MCX5406820.1 hypothetical protein [Streptomyces sp. NBC_00086]
MAIGHADNDEEINRPVELKSSPHLGADLWPRLPASWQDRAHGAAQQRYGHVFDGVAGAAGPWWPLRPMVFSAAFHQELGELSDRLAVLVLEACRRRAGTAGELLDLLGVPAEQMPLLRKDEPLGDHLIEATRPDVVLERGIPKFVEINIDGAVGGTAQADLVSSRFHSVLEAELPELSLTVPPSAVDSRFAQIRAQFDGAGEVHLAIPMYAHGILPGAATEADRIRRHQPMVDSARRLGIVAVPCPWRELGNDADFRLVSGETRFDAVLRLFITAVEPPSAGFTALINSVQHGAVQMHTPEASWLLSNKAVLAWLWEDIERLAPEDRQFVHTHLPLTVAVTPEQEDTVRQVIPDRQDWVLKPANGHGGDGVVLGRAVDDETWRTALRRAVAKGGHVLQRFVQADRTDMAFYDDRTGTVRSESVPFVLGPFLFGRQISNIFVRHSCPGGGQVINALQGSAMNTVLIAGSLPV